MRLPPSEITIEVLREFLPVRKLYKLGTGYGMLLPRAWVELYCDEIEEHEWVELYFDGERIEIIAINKAWLEKQRNTMMIEKRE